MSSKSELIEHLSKVPATGPNAKVAMVAEKAATNPRLGMVQRRHGESQDAARDRAGRVWRAFDRRVSVIDELKPALAEHIKYLLETDASLDPDDIDDIVTDEREHLKEVAAKIAERQPKVTSPIAGAWEGLMAASPDAPINAQRSRVLSETFGSGE